MSQTDTVSTAAIQVFTGNQIAPRGDMSSRSLMIALDADQPDPEVETSSIQLAGMDEV